jgi:hypothetical protein
MMQKQNMACPLCNEELHELAWNLPLNDQLLAAVEYDNQE